MLLALWTACNRHPAILEGPDLVAAPTAPLARTLRVETDVPTRLSVGLKGGGTDSEVQFPGFSTSHLVPVYGARPGTTMEVSATVEDEEGNRTTATTTFETPRPDNFPAVTVREVDLGSLQTRYVLAPLKTPEGRAWLVVLDARDGGVVWWYTGPEDFSEIDFTERGTLLGLAKGGFLELDLLGGEVVRYRPEGAPSTLEADYLVQAAGFTHELVETETGFLTLSERARSVPAYPNSYEAPEELGGPEDIVDVAVMTIARDGTLQSRWSMADRLNPARIGFDGLDYLGNGYDWAHGNAVVVDPSGGVVVSLRHQDALVALDDAGELRWILSHPYGWDARTEPFVLTGLPAEAWPLHQHGPSFDGDGNLLYLDNGNVGYTPYTDDVGRGLRSRVAAMRIDEEALTAELAWEWWPPQELYSPALGNATALPGGHVLADFGFVSGQDGADNEVAGRPMRSVRVFEFDPVTGAIALDLSVDTDVSDFPDGVKLYRAHSLTSLYPPDVVVVR